MINSRWPWPIGTKLSTTFNPVSNDLFTELLTIIEGALDSINLLVFVFIKPFSSIGWPND